MAARQRGWELIPSPHPFPCRRCGATVRNVTTTAGQVITINEDPDPNGNIIPWPAPSSTAMAQARILTVPVTDQEAWSRHACPVT